MYFTPEVEVKIKEILRTAANELDKLRINIEGINVTIKVEIPKERTEFGFRHNIKIEKVYGLPLQVEVIGRKDPPRP